MEHALRGKSAIVSLGVAGLGEAKGYTSWDIMAQSALAALADAGLALKDVDGLFMRHDGGFDADPDGGGIPWHPAPLCRWHADGWVVFCKLSGKRHGSD